MNNKTIYVIVLIVVIFMVFSLGICNQRMVWYEDNNSKETTLDTVVDSTNINAIDSTYVEESTDYTTDEVVEKTDYYQIIRSNALYYCYFYDNNHDIVKEEGPLSKCPKVIEVEDKLLRFTLQAGTGNGTRWGYYYDIERIVFSDIFAGVFDECVDKVACVGLNKVIVSNIFDSSKYYKEFSEFLYPFSPSATPITNIEFSEDGTSIMVSYLTGEDYQEVTEVFYL